MPFVLIFTSIMFFLGIVLFGVRTVLFFKSRDFKDESAANAFITMRVGMVMVASSIAAKVSYQLMSSWLIALNTMIVSGLVIFLLLILFTAQISRWLAVLAIRADLQRLQDEEHTLELLEQREDGVKIIKIDEDTPS